MVNVERTLHVDAPPADVWRVIADVSRWAEWTPTVRRMERLDAAPFGAGSGARIWLLGALGSSVWRVTSFDEGRAFTWESRTAGVHSIADHTVEPDGAGSRVTLTMTQRGIGSLLLRPFLARISRRNLQIEIDGLKRRAESNT